MAAAAEEEETKRKEGNGPVAACGLQRGRKRERAGDQKCHYRQQDEVHVERPTTEIVIQKIL